ncbi:MAG: ABC transporter ATP-binding protein [Pseudodesulfovibrio sp.]
MTPHVSIRNLSVRFPVREGQLRAVDGLDLELTRGERFGLVGESGSGKTMLALSLMGLLPPSARRTGSIRLDGRELTGLNSREMRRLRGRELAMVFEQPGAYLDPLFPVGRQIEEAVRAHAPSLNGEARQRMLELLRMVGMPDPQRQARQYPFELSGGMQQRAMIAIALASSPGLLLADEPTTALDPRVQVRILDLLDRLATHNGMTLLLITHNLAAVRRLCSRVAVMYAGQVVETGDMRQVLESPRHPYTRALCASLAGNRAAPIDGNPPSLADLPAGCRFHPRCPLAEPACAAQSPVLSDGVRCLKNHAA